ncbi:hypothetical protein [Bradyrhizobium sp. CCBAU 53415]|uniref:hypothetical protein n=1 Tax=Bradyrhizobium sp. CCBAU 53415 TaxID=1325119 RepID=UPI0023068C4B|nr:hypothetical protein [Bradyrhizobium sp. CCBAU 53415]MDA9464321.1 hypothetical protein [Bradyrhizobium sp. CCBAU 53415]
MNIAPVIFVDRDTGDEAAFLVRVMEDHVGLALSLKRNGDIEVILDAKELDQIIDALQLARSAVRQSLKS